MSLADLQQRFNTTRQRCRAIPKTGVRLTQAFQDKFLDLIRSGAIAGGYTQATFDDGTVHLESSGKSSYISASGFLIAKELSNYLSDLYSYRDIAKHFLNDDEIKRAKTNSGSFRQKVDSNVSDASDNKNIKRFLSDYGWWGGGKTIDRRDFFISPLMKCAELQAESQSAIAELAEQMQLHPELASTLTHTTKTEQRHAESNTVTPNNAHLSPYLSAIRTKPFILLAGISGTGKSRLVRKLAEITCPANLADPQRPGNFEMIQVRPNWHDSTELMGYTSRISGKPEYVVTDFVRFLAKAWLFPETPFFLCLDEMNLAPVEQYFAEYLNVIETRKRNTGGYGAVRIVTDVLVRLDESIRLAVVENLLKPYWEDAWKDKVSPEHVKAVKAQFLSNGGIRIPANFVVMGTVNMDETTFSFSRKVLDRAMSFELNEVNLRKGLVAAPEEGRESIPAVAVLPRFVEGLDVYADNQSVCDKVLSYLEAINTHLEGTPFKIAYRARNEIMVYTVERMDGDETLLPAALDEATALKILPRIEGDEQKIKKEWLEKLHELIAEKLAGLAEQTPYPAENAQSASLNKLKQMLERLEDGYTSFWS